ncbi:MAG: 2TM domain-containing protein [Rhizobiaceae bacterium]|nr:2TM domain-containing protein [Rhizobiaceae bacterium]
MTDQTPYQRARKRALTKFGFYKHFAIYFGVITLLIVINLITSPQYHWYIWPMVGWGVAIAIHAAKAFLPSSEETLIERLTEKEIEKDQFQ